MKLNTVYSHRCTFKSLQNVLSASTRNGVGDSRSAQKQFRFWTMNSKSLELGSNTYLLITIGTDIINTLLPTRNKFVYSCSTKSAPRVGRTLGKHVVRPAGCESVFPAKRRGDACRRGRGLAGGQEKVAGARILQPKSQEAWRWIVGRALGCRGASGAFCAPGPAVFGASWGCAGDTSQTEGPTRIPRPATGPPHGDRDRVWCQSGLRALGGKWCNAGSRAELLPRWRPPVTSPCRPHDVSVM